MPTLFYSSKCQGEVAGMTVDLSLRLNGETITGANVTLICDDNVDANTYTMIYGAPTVSGNLVTQMFRNGVPGCRYQFSLTVTTSGGRTLVNHGRFDVTE